MHYKKILKNRKSRMKLLDFVSFIPDELMIKMQYRIATGRKLNLKNPQRFTEKLKWYKLYYRNPLLKICSDKYQVRDYVTNKGLGNILVPLIKCYDNPKNFRLIDLPDSFVVKTTLGAGNNQVIVVNNINDINKEYFEKKIRKWKLNCFKKSISREWGYESDKEKLIVEENLVTKHNQPILDYKFFCFNGEPKYFYIVSNRNSPKGPNIDIFDIDFQRLYFGRIDLVRSNATYDKPVNFNKMIEIAKILSKDFPHVRIDLYNFNGTIYFSEMTFYNGSGYITYKPEKYDFIIGDYFPLVKF
jgi:hypothetical protein